MLEGEFILQRQKSPLSLSRHGVSHFQNGFVLPQILEVPPTPGAGQERRARGRSSFMAALPVVGTPPTFLPCLRDEEGHGAGPGGSTGARGLNTTW